jgi:hypothetical protein
MILTLVIILHLQGKPRVTDVILDCCVPKIMTASAGNASHDLSASFGERAHWPSHKHIESYTKDLVKQREPEKGIQHYRFFW